MLPFDTEEIVGGWSECRELIGGYWLPAIITAEVVCIDKSFESWTAFGQLRAGGELNTTFETGFG